PAPWFQLLKVPSSNPPLLNVPAKAGDATARQLTRTKTSLKPDFMIAPPCARQVMFYKNNFETAERESSRRSLLSRGPLYTSQPTHLGVHSRAALPKENVQARYRKTSFGLRYGINAVENNGEH